MTEQEYLLDEMKSAFYKFHKGVNTDLLWSKILDLIISENDKYIAELMKQMEEKETNH